MACSSCLKPHDYKPGGMQWDVATGHREFDRQFTAPTRGNRLGGGQTSCHIRPRGEIVNPVGQIVPAGYLREFDLDWLFRDAPEYIRAYIRSVTETESAIAYQFHHATPTWRESMWSRQRYRTGDYHEVVHGYVVTRAADHRLLRVFYTGPTRKSRLVVDTLLPYIAKLPAEVYHAQTARSDPGSG